MPSPKPMSTYLDSILNRASTVTGVTLPFTRVNASSSSSEEVVPLTSINYDETDLDSSSSPYRTTTKPPRRSPFSTCSWQRSLILLLITYLLYRLTLYIYSDPEAWPLPLGPTPTPVPLLVRAAGRKYLGHTEGEAQRVVAFKGIRYALAPVGEKRFRRAVPLGVMEWNEEEWEKVEVYEAKEFGEGCPRPKGNIAGSVEHDGEEDCLKLNIFGPREQSPGVLLPVMLWIHGGGFVSGSSNEDKYNPQELIERGLSMNQPFIFVSINYRLGGLGFSAAPPVPGKPPTPPHIPTQAPEHLDLNVGFKDQLEAMYFVQREIVNWGGDPTKVTLVGHSAGAMSVGLHQIYSPPELFRAAFMLSGAPTSFPVPWPHDAGARTLHPLPGPAQCPSPVQQDYGPPSNELLLSCLRDLPLEKYMTATRTLSDHYAVNGWFPWYPVLEGEWEGSWLDVRPSDRIVRGTYSKIPVIMGSTTDEGTRFISPKVETQQDVQDALRDAFAFTFGAIEDLLTPIWDFYPDEPSLGSPYFTGNDTFGLSSSYKRGASLLGDVFFQAPRRHFLRETPKDFGEPSWNYLYEEPKLDAEERMGVAHAADLLSWFGHPNATDPEMHHLSRHMSSYLINFVANMDPNGPGLRHWPQYGMDRRTLQLKRHNISIVHDDDRLEAMRFLNINNPIFAR